MELIELEDRLPFLSSHLRTLAEFGHLWGKAKLGVKRVLWVGGEQENKKCLLLITFLLCLTVLLLFYFSKIFSHPSKYCVNIFGKTHTWEKYWEYPFLKFSWTTHRLELLCLTLSSLAAAGKGYKGNISGHPSTSAKSRKVNLRIYHATRRITLESVRVKVTLKSLDPSLSNSPLLLNLSEVARLSLLHMLLLTAKAMPSLSKSFFKVSLKMYILMSITLLFQSFYIDVPLNVTILIFFFLCILSSTIKA